MFSLQYLYNIKQTSDENKEKISIRGLLVDPIPNSQNNYNITWIVWQVQCSKENHDWDPGKG